MFKHCPNFTSIAPLKKSANAKSTKPVYTEVRSTDKRFESGSESLRKSLRKDLMSPKEFLETFGQQIKPKNNLKSLR